MERAHGGMPPLAALLLRPHGLLDRWAPGDIQETLPTTSSTAPWIRGLTNLDKGSSGTDLGRAHSKANPKAADHLSEGSMKRDLNIYGG